MKEAFFAFLAIAAVLLAVAGVIYMFVLGVYRLLEDWRLGRELAQLRDEAAQRRSQQTARQHSAVDPMTAFHDGPPVREPQGVVILPLDADWSHSSSRVESDSAPASSADETLGQTASSAFEASEAVPLESDEEERAPHAEPPSDASLATEHDDWPNRTLD